MDFRKKEQISFISEVVALKSRLLYKIKRGTLLLKRENNNLKETEKLKIENFNKDDLYTIVRFGDDGNLILQNESNGEISIENSEDLKTNFLNVGNPITLLYIMESLEVLREEWIERNSLPKHSGYHNSINQDGELQITAIEVGGMEEIPNKYLKIDLSNLLLSKLSEEILEELYNQFKFYLLRTNVKEKENNKN